MTRIAGRHVVLGVSGGIASYKACTIARRLTEAGVHVDVVMTPSAAEFVRPLTFEALTARPVVTSLWDQGRALDHVRMGRAETDLIVVAPATAQLIARMAQGMADDFLTALLLARKAPVLLCPAMNDVMYARPETQANLKKVSGVGGQGPGATILGPATGPLAHGEGEGPGRMVEPEEIIAWVERMLTAAESRFPGLRQHVRFAEGGTPRTLERYTRNSDGATYGWALGPDQIGPGRPANITPLAGLYLAGHWAQPGGGVYGVVTSGVSAARAILGVPSDADLWRELGS